MKSLQTILNEKVELLLEFWEQSERERYCGTCNHHPASGIIPHIRGIKRLLPYEEELRQIIGENEIFHISESAAITIDDYIKVFSRDKIGVYDYKYFQLNNGKLELIFNGGNCPTAFYDYFIRPRAGMREVWGEVEK